MGATILRFDAEGRHFTVRVSDNFRDDYASKPQNVSRLAPFLRESSTGRVIVTNKAIEESQ
jgi:UDP-N-acetylmuramyl tripeptide synthase